MQNLSHLPQLRCTDIRRVQTHLLAYTYALSILYVRHLLIVYISLSYILILQLNLPLQTNAHDCGVYVCLYARRLLKFSNVRKSYNYTRYV